MPMGRQIYTELPCNFRILSPSQAYVYATILSTIAWHGDHLTVVQGMTGHALAAGW